MNRLKLSLRWIVSTLALAAGAWSCGRVGDSASTTGTELLPLGVQSASGLEVLMLAAEPLHLGRNTVYYQVTDSSLDAEVTDATLTVAPSILRGVTKHGCPVVQPVRGLDGQSLYRGRIIFAMPDSAATDHWDVDVAVSRPGGAPAVTVTFAQLAVQTSIVSKEVVVTEGASQVTYVMTLNFTAELAVGKNDYFLTVHRAAADFLSFAAVEDLTVRVVPEMVSMGHGSSGNVDPVYRDGGDYAGQVNLTMPGEWTLHVDLEREAASVGTVDWVLQL